MKPKHPGRRSPQIAAALGALLVTASCTGLSAQNPSTRAVLPDKLDGGVGQLMSYCGKFRSKGDLVTAAALCERAHRLDPDNPAPLMRLAEILAEMGQPRQAVAAYQRIIKSAPDHAEAQFALGKAYITLEQYDLALGHLQVALQNKSEDARIYNALGIANGLLGAHGSAQEAFQSGLQAEPGDVSLRSNLGLSLVLVGRYQEGITILEEVAADPAATETSLENLQLAQGLYSTAQAEVALAALDKPGDAPEDVSDLDAEQITLDRGEPMDLSAQIEAPMAEDPLVVTPLAVRLDASRQTAEISLIDDSDPPDAELALDQATLPTTQTAKAWPPEAVEDFNPTALIGDYLSVDVRPDAPAAQISTPNTQIANLSPTAPIHDTPGADANYTVQLASYKSEENARKGWELLRGKATDLLQEFDPVIRRADLGPDKGVFYRLRTPRITKDAADQLCNALKERGIDCLKVKETSGTADTAAR